MTSTTNTQIQAAAEAGDYTQVAALHTACGTYAEWAYTLEMRGLAYDAQTGRLIEV